MPDDLAAKTMLGAFSRDDLRRVERQGAPRRARSEARSVSIPLMLGVVRAVDGLAVLAAGFIAWNAEPVTVGRQVAWPVIMLVTLLAANALELLGAHARPVLEHFGRALGRMLAAIAATAAIALGILALADQLTTEVEAWLLMWLAGGLLLLSLARAALALQIGAWNRSGRLCPNVVVVGAGAVGQKLLRHLNTRAAHHAHVLGVYDDRLARLPQSCMGHPILGNVDDLVRDAREKAIDLVILALPLSADRRLLELTEKLRRVAVDVCVCPDLFGFQLAPSQGVELGGLPLLGVLGRPLRDWRGVLKAVEDRVLGTLIFLMIAPVLLTIALFIKLDSPGPVFFRQRRYGLNNRLIEVLKFRTMYQHATDANAEQLTRRNDPRVTRIGAFLRRTSLDELPQFINVMRGEMSIVGPRPHAIAAKAGGLLYQEAVREYDVRHRMKPGITGWAQVNGWRGETRTVEQIRKRVEHDLYYIEHWSVPLDLLIILRTVLGGFTGRSAY